MKTTQTSKRLLPVLVIGLIIPAAALAEENNRGKSPRMKPQHRAKILEELDIDGDGEVSQAEKKVAMKARREERRAKMLEKYDADGDGELSIDEKIKLRGDMRATSEKRKEMREKLMEKFDADGDGKLSASERKAAREYRKNNKGEKKSPIGPPVN